MSNGYTRKRSSWQVHKVSDVKYTSGLVQPLIYAQWGTVEQITGSGHPWVHRKKKHPQKFHDIGGMMDLRRKHVGVIESKSVDVKTGGLPGQAGYNSYKGLLVNASFISTSSTLVQPTVPTNIVPYTTVKAYGTKGWNKFKPTKPSGSLGQAIGELREGIPFSPVKLFKHREDLKRIVSNYRHRGIRNVGHDVGSAYLGTVFGVLPLVKDIQELCKNVLNMDKRIQQLARDNGRPVRRSGRIDIDTSNDIVRTTGGQNAFIHPAIHINLWQSGHTSIREVETFSRTEYRFSGRFRYWIDPYRLGHKGIPDRYRFQLTRIAFGLDPTDVSTIYQLLPWSWLIDWLVPLGPLIDNLVNDQMDNLVADYAYVSAVKNTTEISTVTSMLSGGVPVRLVNRRITETKQRYFASPYGFGILLGDLSLRQLAILASLGLTKLDFGQGRNNPF